MDKIIELQKQLEEANRLISVQKQYREDSIKSLTEEIQRALKPGFDDFYETINIPINEMLGEIYREKICDIAKILSKYDICVREE